MQSMTYVLHTFPPTYFPDFFVGCVAAACVKAHINGSGMCCGSRMRHSEGSDPLQPEGPAAASLMEEGTVDGNSVRRRGASNGDAASTSSGSRGASASEMARSGALAARGTAFRGLAADATAFFMIAFIFILPPREKSPFLTWLYGIPSAAIIKDPTTTAMGAHVWSPVIAYWCYCVTATDTGVGLVARFLRHPALVSLGNYAFHVYLFAKPNMFIWQLMMNKRMWGEGDTSLYEPKVEPILQPMFGFIWGDRTQTPAAWAAEVVTLFFIAPLYAHLVEEPVVKSIRTVSDKYFRAPSLRGM